MTPLVPLRENVNKEGDVKVYFFWKSLEQCQQKYLEPYVHKCLTELEEKWNVTHSETLASFINHTKTQLCNAPIDPLVPFILGDKKKPLVKEILDFLENDLFMMQQRAFAKEAAFIDLCIVLGDQGRAEKCAERFHHKNYPLLESVKDNKDGTVVLQNIMTDTVTRFHTNHTNDVNESGFLTTLIHYVLEHINDPSLTSKISGFWWLGYYWDAICLGTILLPGNPIVDVWKSSIGSMFNDTITKSWINAARHVISLKNGFNDTSKGNYDSIHPIVAYRLLKIEIAQLHKTLRENEDLAYLSDIEFKASVLQKLVARLLISPEPCLAEDVASDAVVYIKGAAPNNWTDYFPQVSRIIYEVCANLTTNSFQPAIRMLTYIIAALKSLRTGSLGQRSAFRYNFAFEKDSISVMETVVSHWLKIPMGKEIWQKEPKNALPVSTLCRALMEQIANIGGEEYHKQTTRLGLYLATHIANRDMTKDNVYAFATMSCNYSGIKDEHLVKTFCEAIGRRNFNPDPDTWEIISSDSDENSKSDISNEADAPSETEIQCVEYENEQETQEHSEVPIAVSVENEDAPVEPTSDVQADVESEGNETVEPPCSPHVELSETDENGFNSAVEDLTEHDDVESTQSESKIEENIVRRLDDVLSIGSTQSGVSEALVDNNDKDSRFNTMGGEFISKDPNWSLVPKQKDVDSSIDKADTVETEEEQSENTSKDECRLSSTTPTVPPTPPPQSRNELDKLVENSLQEKDDAETIDNGNTATNPNIGHGIPDCTKILFNTGGFDDSSPSLPPVTRGEANAVKSSDVYEGRYRREGSGGYGNSAHYSHAGGYGNSNSAHYPPAGGHDGCSYGGHDMRNNRGGSGAHQTYNNPRGGGGQGRGGSFDQRGLHMHGGSGDGVRRGVQGRPESQPRGGGPFRGYGPSEPRTRRGGGSYNN